MNEKTTPEQNVIEAAREVAKIWLTADAKSLDSLIIKLDKALTAYEKSKEEPTCKTCLNYDGSGWCILHKFNVGEQQVCPDWLNDETIKENDILNHRDLLIKFFMYFRDNGEKNIGMTIEQFVDRFLSQYVC